MSNRINTQMALDFLQLQKDLPKILKAYNLSKLSVANGVKIPQASFYRKADKQLFSAQEMIKICKFINS